MIFIEYFKNKIWIIVLTILIAIEIYLRYTSPDILNIARIIMDSEDPILGYELIPNAKTKFEGFICKIPASTIEISTQGLRDKFYNLQKEDGIKRIAFLGDSFVFGMGVNYNDTIPKQLEILLNKESLVKYEVMNCGVIGYNLIQQIELLKKKVINFNPDMIIFLISGNDADLAIRRPHNKISNFLFRWSYIYRNLFIKISKSFDISKGQMSKMRWETCIYFEELKKIIKKDQEIVLVIKNFSPWMQEVLNICKRERIKFIDLSNSLKIYRNSILISKVDGHFNPKGTKLIANEIYKFFNNIPN